MIYLSNEPYPQEISVPRSFGVIVPQRNTYLSTADIAADLTTDSDTKVLAASQGVVLKEMVDAKADASDVYTKQEVDEALAGKQDELVAGDNITIEGNVISATGGGSGDSYTRAETDALLAEKADADDVYTKSEVDTALAGKADKADTYTKQDVDEALAEKADVSDIPTKTSDLQNDSGFVTGQEVSQTYETKSDATAKETALQTAINAKQDILTFDNVPTNGSSNPVKSDGIYDALAGKQATIQDLSVIRSGAAAGATAYQKPATGIPASDIASGVIPDAVTANPTIPSGTTPTDLQNIKVGNDYFNIPSGGGGGSYRLISSGTISEDVREINITKDSGNNSFSLKEVMVFAKVRGNSASYTGWVKLNMFCDMGNQISGALFQQFAAATTDPYYTFLVQFRRIANYCVPILFWRSSNNTSVKNSFAFVANLYVVENLLEVSGGINRLVLGGYQNGGLGEGTTYEIYGIDA